MIFFNMLFAIVNNVNLITGNFYYEETDVPVFAERTYNSVIQEQSMFGFGWTSFLESRLIFSPEGGIVFIQGPDYSESLYTSASDAPNAEKINESINKLIELMNKKQSMDAMSKKVKIEYLKNTPSQRTTLYKEYKIQGTPKEKEIYSSGKNTLTILNKIYTITYADGRVFTFNKEGNLTKYQNKTSGEMYVLTYDQKGLLQSVTNQKKEKYTYSWNNNVVTKISSGKKEYNYTYEDKNSYKVLTKITSFGLVKSYEYKTFNTSTGSLLLLNKINSDNQWEIFYNTKGLVSTIKQEDNVTLNYEFSGEKEKLMVTVKTDPSSKNIAPIMSKHTHQRVFDPNTSGYRLVSSKREDPGGEKERFFDVNGFVIKTITTSFSTKNTSMVYLYERDSKNNIITKKQGSGNKGEFSYPALVFNNVFENNKIRQTTKTIYDANGKESSKDIFSVTYDTSGRYTSFKNSTGDDLTISHGKDYPLSLSYSIDNKKRVMNLEYDSRIGKLTIATLKENNKILAKAYYKYEKGEYVGAQLDPITTEEDFSKPFSFQNYVQSQMTIAEEVL